MYVKPHFWALTDFRCGHRFWRPVKHLRAMESLISSSYGPIPLSDFRGALKIPKRFAYIYIHEIDVFLGPSKWRYTLGFSCFSEFWEPSKIPSIPRIYIYAKPSIFQTIDFVLYSCFFSFSPPLENLRLAYIYIRQNDLPARGRFAYIYIRQTHLFFDDHQKS